MSDIPFSTPWALALLGAATWTTAFSLTQPPVRGYRNLGLLASYGLGVAMAIRLPWRDAALTWAAFGVFGGVAYLGYEGWSRWRNPTPGDRLRPGTLLHGLLAWPVMLPEAVEYLLADLGVLTPPAPPPDGVADTATVASDDHGGD